MMVDAVGDERSMVTWFAERSPTPPNGDTWIGDDTAVLQTEAGTLLFATDSVVEGVHFFSGVNNLADAGWKALVRNLSDVAAMGGVPTHAVAAVSGATDAELRVIHEGLTEASVAYGCPVVGGDLSKGSEIVITVAILGRAGKCAPVLRSGARPGDVLYLTGPLGASSAGLRLLQEDSGASGHSVAAYRRPRARISEGQLAALSGATAMIDISDGLGIDLHRLADASRVGFAISDIPVATGATINDALSGGEDYGLLFAAPLTAAISAAFLAAELSVPVQIGKVLADLGTRTCGDDDLPASGWQHDLGEREIE